jgi:hypothetical protein
VPHQGRIKTRDPREYTNPLCDTKTVSTESSVPYEFAICRLVSAQVPLLDRYFQLAASVTTNWTSIPPTSTKHANKRT